MDYSNFYFFIVLNLAWYFSFSLIFHQLWDLKYMIYLSFEKNVDIAQHPKILYAFAFLMGSILKKMFMKL